MYHAGGHMRSIRRITDKSFKKKHLKERIQPLEAYFNAKKLPMQPVVDKFDSGLSGMQPMKMIVSGQRKRGKALRNGGFEK